MKNFHGEKSLFKRLRSVPQLSKQKAKRETIFRKELKRWCELRDVSYSNELEHNVLKLSPLVEASRKRLIANAIGGIVDADPLEHSPGVKKLRLRSVKAGKTKREKYLANMRRYPTGRNADPRQAAAFELCSSLERAKGEKLRFSRPMLSGATDSMPSGADFWVLKAALEYLFYFRPPINSQTLETWIKKHRKGEIPLINFFLVTGPEGLATPATERDIIYRHGLILACFCRVTAHAFFTILTTLRSGTL